MTAVYTPQSRTISRQILPLLSVAFASFVAVAAVVILQQMALGVALFAGVLALTVCRPRFGLCAVLVLLLTLEPQLDDPIMYYGWLLQSDISSWTPLRFVNFTPIEMILLVTAAVVVLRGVAAHKRLPRTQLRLPTLLLVGITTASAGYGVFSGGSLNIVLWETRSLLAGCLIALLVPALLRKRGDVDRLIDVLLVAAVLLSIEIVWRRLVLLANVPVASLDLEFAHDTPTFLNFAVLLLLARLVWPASGRQRLAAVVIPLILYAEMLTNRRAGWVGLDIGIMLLLVLIFRGRRRLFYLVVLPLALFYCGYLVVAWNATGTWAEPARAVRSIASPDSRDASSDVYRLLEVANIRQNILAHPLTGLGLGKQYAFYLPLPDLSWWPFWHYEAHNTLLWLWMETGPLGFMALLGLVGAGIMRGIQLLSHAPLSAPVLVGFVCLLCMVMAYSYVDLGLVSARADALLGLALGVIGLWGSNPSLLQVP